MSVRADPGSRYQATLDRLYALEARRGWDLKLESVRAALEALGSPERDLDVLHVAGTNGKGSVAAFAHSILVAAGLEPGLYTSPHLEDFRERIRVGSREIDPASVVELTEEVEAAVDQTGVELTFFELTTVVALLAFARTKVSPVLLEVGLGGRLDATNVVLPRVTVITTIALDHERFLGADLSSIAREKAGIVKQNVSLVLGRIGGEALEAITTIARERSAPMRRFETDFRIESSPTGLTYKGRRTIADLHPGLLGRFQEENLAVALAALEAGHWLDDLPDDVIREGVERVRWPGRLERIGRVLLDGAHNPAAARELAAELPRVSGGRPIHLVFGTLADKRWGEIAGFLRPVVSEVTVVPVADRRGEDPERVATAFPGARISSSAPDAVDRALEASAPDGLVVVAGSLFLVGEIRARLAAAKSVDDPGSLR